ncbi:MAG: hypothetical protein ACSHYA_15655 [Opitutaceae bacterium]
MLFPRNDPCFFQKQLCDIGVLNEQQAGKEKLFVHPKLMKLMTGAPNQFEPYNHSINNR